MADKDSLSFILFRFPFVAETLKRVCRPESLSHKKQQYELIWLKGLVFGPGENIKHSLFCVAESWLNIQNMNLLAS